MRYILPALFGILIFIFPATAREGKLNVMVDERMELLTTIQHLAGYPILTQSTINYKKDVDNYFGKYKDHDAVKLYQKIYRDYFAFDAPATYLYHFSFPDFKQETPFQQSDITAYGFDKNADTLKLLMKEFKDFYHKTNFHHFFLAHKPFYDSVIAPVQAKLEGTNVIEVMEKHYGQENKEYNIVLTPMLHDGGYGPMLKTPEGNVFYAIIGPKFDCKEFPEFDADNILNEYVIHEFSHSFVNPLVDKYYEQLKKDSCLLEPIRKRMKEQGYGTWKASLYEHLVRANEIVISETVTTPWKAKEAYTEMVDKDKWIYLKGLVPLVKHEYTANRTKYKTLDDVMSLVITYFNNETRNCK